MAVREPRPLPEHLVAQGPGLAVLLVLDELVEPLVLPEERDEVLRVFLAAVEAVRRGVAAAAEVAERGQALPGSLVQGRGFRGRSGSAAGRRQDADEGATQGVGPRSRRFTASAGSLRRSYSSGRVVSMYFQPSTMTPRSELAP
jgi:hypothetical protein